MLKQILITIILLTILSIGDYVDIIELFNTTYDMLFSVIVYGSR